MNAIVHPAVKEYVKKRAERERERGALKLLVLEAALLIEEHYDEICDGALVYLYEGGCAQGAADQRPRIFGGKDTADFWQPAWRKRSIAAHVRL